MTTTKPDLSVLQRPSGGFAMLAVDQREALRVMMSDARGGAVVTDDQVIDFKLDAARTLTPYASAVLIDRQFAFDQAVEAGVVAEGCGLISSGDHFIPAHGELVGEVEIDRQVDPAHVKASGAVAMKLLVLHRIDQPAGPRIAMVREFVEICDAHGLISIIEPVCRKPLDASLDWDREQAIVDAARELGDLGADLYKGEMPLYGRGPEAEMRRRCAEINEAVASPWVILSSGVAEADFPTAVAVACSEGASGFLAGRAVWASCLAADDVSACLAGAAVDRLKKFGALVDEAMSKR
ncbi:MAG: aldolase [Propioniciclava sp.]|uniref:aldolase n=1 Tax=Propioniciclava sp. TaxID=2038686 RepID=UPI0039E39DFC